MKNLLLLILFLSFSGLQSANAVDDLNLDKFGTFDGDWPFPWGPEADLPSDLDGLYEVRESVDGAYFNIGRDINPETLRPETRIDLFDPCTFKTTASGKAFVRRNTLYGTMVYPDTDKKVKVRMKSYQKSYVGNGSSPQMVLMIMKGNSKEMEKYFPVERIEIKDVVKKCETQSGKRP